MTERKRLIELLNSKISHLVLTDTDFVWTCERINDLADHLLANGVVVPPCKVGDTVYVVTAFISEYQIKEISFDDMFMQFWCSNDQYAIECRHFNFFDERIGKNVFLTREEAEKALEGSRG